LRFTEPDASKSLRFRTEPNQTEPGTVEITPEVGHACTKGLGFFETRFSNEPTAIFISLVTRKLYGYIKA